MAKRNALIETGSVIIFSDVRKRISKELNDWFFEIDKELTTDIAEAVSILMRNCDNTDPVWDIKLESIELESITPVKSLFWLTGGYEEWTNLEHYNRPWCDCYIEFQEEFGLLIVSILSKSVTLGDIRRYFLEYLDLGTLYDFSLGKELLK
jgi:hypothetical protein